MKSESTTLGAAVLTAALFIRTTTLDGAESAAIPLEQLGAVATKQVEGDSLSITPAENGARLHCAFQKLEGQATPEGLWLSSTAEEIRTWTTTCTATLRGRSLAAISFRRLSERL